MGAAAVGAGVGVGVGTGVGVWVGGPMLKRSGTIAGRIVTGGRVGDGVGAGLVCWACAGSAANAAIRPGRYFPACTALA